MARHKERFLSPQADHFAGAKWGEKSACFVRNDGREKNAGLKTRHYTEKEKADPSPPFANDATGFGMTAHSQEWLCHEEKRAGLETRHYMEKEELFVPQRDNGVHARRPQRGNCARGKRHAPKREGNQ